MKVHHLNCGTFRPLGGSLLDGVSAGLHARIVCHCLLLETSRGLVLVDTGLGLNDIDDPHPRMSPFFRRLMRPSLRRESTAWYQIQELGFMPSDVRHIVLTHLDFDHIGGLDDFPDADIHLHEVERLAASNRDGFVSSRRYRPAQMSSRSRWRSYEPAVGSRWFGFSAVQSLVGLPPDVLLVPLPGHTWGHSGVAVDTGDGWLLHAGDAYFHRREMDPARPRCTPGLNAYQRLMEVNRGQRLGNQDRLRDLVRRHGENVTVFSAHDPVEFDELSRGAQESASRSSFKGKRSS